MTTTDEYIVKLKSVAIPDRTIAAKLGITLGELERRWALILAEAETYKKGGYEKLTELFNTMALQYQLLGESLKVVGGVLGNVMLDDELKSLLADDPDQTIKNLRNSAIVLRAYVPAPITILECKEAKEAKPE